MCFFYGIQVFRRQYIYTFLYNFIANGANYNITKGVNTGICDKIRTLRDTCGLSQSALAKKSGVTRSAVNAWEMGLSIPTAQYIVAMAQLFHISTDYLLGLQNSQAIYLDGLTEQEKQLLYAMYGYFTERDTAP